MCLNGTPAGSVKMPGHRHKISGNHLGERWGHECRSEQEGTVWMEQLEEDVRGPMQQMGYQGKYSQEDCSACYAIRDENWK